MSRKALYKCSPFTIYNIASILFKQDYFRFERTSIILVMNVYVRVDLSVVYKSELLCVFSCRRGF